MNRYTLLVACLVMLNTTAPAHAQLSREQANAAAQNIVDEFARSAIADAWREEVATRTLTLHGETMRYTLEQHAEPGPNGYALFISLHGGGQTSEAVNDQQWRNQQSRYRVPGLYLCPRAPRDTWDHFHNEYFYAFIDRLIEQMILVENVDPDRVYLMGYSSGGYGTFQLGPIMADRFAAYATAAAATEGARLENTRNVAWDYQIGEHDSAYGRIELARQSMAEHAALREFDPDGYVARHLIHEGRGHSIQDHDAVPWMAQHTRNPYPQRVVWFQNHDARESSNPARRHFYWLALDDTYTRDDTGLHSVIGVIEGQTVQVLGSGLSHVRVRLNDTMLDLDQPVQIVVNGQPVFEGLVDRREDTMRQTFDEYRDPRYLFPAEVRVEIPEGPLFEFRPAAGSALEQTLERAGEHAAKLGDALAGVSAERRPTMAWLIQTMPERDYATLSAAYLIDTVNLAHDALDGCPWREQIDPAHFQQYILPYAVVNERRDDWRADFYNRLREQAWEHDLPLDAARWINDEFEQLFGVAYHATRRPKPDQSPYESIQARYASCTGLSILMIDACRAVGIPARFVGVARWTDVPGNHNWVEVFDGQWHNIGSSGTDPRDEDWVEARAREQTDAQERMHRVYAGVWRPTEDWFPLVWDLTIDDVPAIDITPMYNARLTVPLHVGDGEALIRVYWQDELIIRQTGSGEVDLPLFTGGTFRVVIERADSEPQERELRT